MPYF
jgi:hypothetical protein